MSRAVRNWREADPRLHAPVMFQASLLEQDDEANGCKQSVVRNRACSAHRADTLEHRSIVYAEWCRPDKMPQTGPRHSGEVSCSLSRAVISARLRCINFVRNSLELHHEAWSAAVAVTRPSSVPKVERTPLGRGCLSGIRGLGLLDMPLPCWCSWEREEMQVYRMNMHEEARQP